jgi:hypothetical protein
MLVICQQRILSTQAHRHSMHLMDLSRYQQPQQWTIRQHSRQCTLTQGLSMLSLPQEQLQHHLVMTQGSRLSTVSTSASLLEPALLLSHHTVKVRVSFSSKPCHSQHKIQLCHISIGFDGIVTAYWLNVSSCSRKMKCKHTLFYMFVMKLGLLSVWKNMNLRGLRTGPEQCSKWKCRIAGIFLKSETRIPLEKLKR